jgi:hypothetical protein
LFARTVKAYFNNPFFPWLDRGPGVITGCAATCSADIGNDQIGIPGIFKLEGIADNFTLYDFAKIMFNLGEFHDRELGLTAVPAGRIRNVYHTGRYLGLVVRAGYQCGKA